MALDITHRDYAPARPLSALGLVPPLAAATVLATAVYFLTRWLTDPAEDWSDNTVFRDKAMQLHAQLLAVQCAVVGANVDVRDLNGKIVCPAGTTTLCKPNEVLLGRWRSFLANFSSFFSNAMGRTLGPNESDAKGLKSYVEQALKFTHEFHTACPKATESVYIEPVPPEAETGSGLPWGWILGAGLGAVAVLALLRTPAAPIVIQTSEQLERGARSAGRAIRDRF